MSLNIFLSQFNLPAENSLIMFKFVLSIVLKIPAWKKNIYVKYTTFGREKVGKIYFDG